ncbi:alpha/beta hydrolase family protein [Chryseobacterium sp. R2A-55]|uniref:alpha/beta hydrolase family protein n=1 Tax=Chryseobacterium sp. R2A-55 TaxID=2744445 RepID=UPI001F4855F0|nr:prolyl oligopeptidase family serine peptidase [Chryseobacterium sp. R2A-55]
MKAIAYLALFTLCFLQMFNSQTRRDSLEYQMNHQYRLKILSLSGKGEWVLAAKYYDLNRDSLLILSTKKSVLKPISLVGFNMSQGFLKEEAIIAASLNKAVYRNLKSDRNIIYNDIKKVTTLEQSGRYSILNNNSTFTVYDISGNELYRLDSIQGFPQTDNQNKMYVLRKTGSLYEVDDVSGAGPRKLYAGTLKIKRFELSQSGKLLYVIEEKQDDLAEQAVIINIVSGVVLKPIIHPINKEDYLSVNEIGDKGSYLIKAQSKIKRSKNVEIWYGNDGNLINHQLEFDAVNTYWLVDASGKATLLPTAKFHTLLCTGNDRYVLAFTDGELQNYVTRTQDIKISLLNLYSLKCEEFDIVKDSSLYLSMKGEYLLYLNMNSEWVLCDMVSSKKRVIAKDFLKNPVFNFDCRLIYFESDNGLLVYDVLANEFNAQLCGKENSTRILNKARTGLMASYFHIYRSTLNKNEPLLVQAKNTFTDSSAYFSVRDKIQKPIIKSTPKFIREFYYTADKNRFVYTEESYNDPIQLAFRDIERKKEVKIYKAVGNNVDKTLKREMIYYKNSDHKELKGILYYPKNFNPEKKYPVVVRIYQIQSDTYNQHLILGYNNDIAFDIRALVESGYFVYLPDIVYGKMGTGLSALDCVNKALDAIENRSYINKEKIGLTGHSHGGYETNFIATHSNRFAAYISGAGNSDLVRSYFSYNYNFHSPFYWQYENGQYEMKIPFSENKKLYFSNSPINYCENVIAPMLLWAGKKDENIAWDQVMEFYIGLRRNNKDVIALFYSSHGHNLDFSSAERKDLYYKVLEWWDYFLKDKKNALWIDKQMKRVRLTTK